MFEVELELAVSCRGFILLSLRHSNRFGQQDVVSEVVLGRFDETMDQHMQFGRLPDR